MQLSANSSDLALLRRFAPLDELSQAALAALAPHVQRLQAPKGRLVCVEGDDSEQTLYLLSGTVTLLKEGEVIGSVRSATQKSRYPLAHELPRQHSVVVASEQIEYLQFDQFVDVSVLLAQTGAYQVQELQADTAALVSDGSAGADHDDWMSALLQSKALHQIPPANLQALFMRLQRMHYRAGEMVVRQGDAGDYFYVVMKGLCEVTRNTPLNQQGVRLAELKMGDTFGEEALICQTRRNASITMVTDGILMRLGKHDFQTLLQEPMLHRVDYATAHGFAGQGARWLDVRLPGEFKQGHLVGATNLPLTSLRLKFGELERACHYLVYCDNGRRSSACAYLLAERGFTVSVLHGGLIAAMAQS